jgi:small subunit ribosomal protein S1
MRQECREVKQGSMERTADTRQVAPDDVEWWASLDEGYWQALLTQGELASETVPLAGGPGLFDMVDAELQVVAKRGDTGEGSAQGWETAQLALDRGELFCLKVSGANRGGLLVDWNGVQGFVPASHLKEMPRCQNPRERMVELAQYIGRSLTVRLIEVEPRLHRLVFSERATESGLTPSAILASLRPGAVCQGVVTNLTTFGAFVDLGGIEGLIHISELSWDRVHDPKDILHPAQEIEVYVLGVNPDEGRIALSLKRMRPNPWLEVDSRYQVGQLLEGKVTNVVNFGAFVRVEEGVEGLIHVSELAEGTFLHPRNVVSEGDVVQVRVLNLDPGNQRLALSLRQAHSQE